MICASEDPAESHACLRLGACSVNGLWVRVRDAISGVLDATTLADLVPPPHLVELDARPREVVPVMSALRSPAGWPPARPTHRSRPHQ